MKTVYVCVRYVLDPLWPLQLKPRKQYAHLLLNQANKTDT